MIKKVIFSLNNISLDESRSNSNEEFFRNLLPKVKTNSISLDESRSNSNEEFFRNLLPKKGDNK
jgi:hypothetical protein